MKSMIFKLLLPAVTSGLALFACWAQAETVAKTYPVKNFTEFVSGGNTAIEISQDGTEYLRVEADAEVMERVKVDQSGKRVSVWVKNDGKFFSWFGSANDPVRVVLRVKQLDYLEISGGAQATSSELKGERLKVDVSGAGKIHFATLSTTNLRMDLSGAANVNIDKVTSQTQDFDLSGASKLEIQSPSSTGELNAGASGASNFRARKLVAKEARLEASGASHIEAAVTGRLDANASGASSVDYYGNPLAKTDASGASHVNAHDGD